VLAAAVFTLLSMWIGVRAGGPASHSISLGSIQLDVSPSFSGKAQVYIPLAGWEIEAPVFSAPYAFQAQPRRVDRAAIVRASKGVRKTLNKTKGELKTAAILTFVRSFLFALLGALAAGGIVVLLARTLDYRPRPALLAGAGCFGFAVVVVLVSGLWVWQSLDIKAFKHPKITLGHGKALTIARVRLENSHGENSVIRVLSRLVARGQRIRITVVRR
jgi:hypothetical protein